MTAQIQQCVVIKSQTALGQPVLVSLQVECTPNTERM